MAGVVVFLDKTDVPNNLTEIHFFDDDRDMLNFSMANRHRKHLVRAVLPEHQHRTPGPATKAMLKFLASELEFIGSNFHSETVPKGAGYRLRTELLTDNVKAFIAEWKEAGE